MIETLIVILLVVAIVSYFLGSPRIDGRISSALWIVILVLIVLYLMGRF